MESYEYQTMYDYETSYWWYVGLHRILQELLIDLRLDSYSRILDAGCGTGQFLFHIKQISGYFFGFDLSENAVSFWEKRGINNVFLASLNDIPLKSAVFNAVTSIDVLECDEVDEKEAIKEITRLLKPGGYFLIIVPAYNWLKTPDHHNAVHASRRYTRKRLKGLLSSEGLVLVRITHLFMLVFPAIVLYRMTLRFLRIFQTKKVNPRSELKPLPPIINQGLITVMRLEQWLLNYFNLPIGSSIVAVARKK